jgi:hypothetical protein
VVGGADWARPRWITPGWTVTLARADVPGAADADPESPETPESPERPGKGATATAAVSPHAPTTTAISFGTRIIDSLNRPDDHNT